jgi:hypothetical protein
MTNAYELPVQSDAERSKALGERRGSAGGVVPRRRDWSDVAELRNYPAIRHRQIENKMLDIECASYAQVRRALCAYLAEGQLLVLLRRSRPLAIQMRESVQHCTLLGTEDQYGQNQVKDQARRATFYQNLTHVIKSFINQPRVQLDAVMRT